LEERDGLSAFPPPVGPKIFVFAARPGVVLPFLTAKHLFTDFQTDISPVRKNFNDRAFLDYCQFLQVSEKRGFSCSCEGLAGPSFGADLVPKLFKMNVTGISLISNC
jgi:hypothetical protein